MSQHLKSKLQDSIELFNKVLKDEILLSSIDTSIDLFVSCYKNNGKIFSCGNGGSMCDSMHFAEELTGRYHKDRPPLPAMALNDPSYLTCVLNDYGPDVIFSRILEGWGNSGDVLLAISTSGNSKNVIEAAKSAKKRGMKTVALLGKDGGELKKIVDIPIVIPSMTTSRIQEVHIHIIHNFIEGIERNLYPNLY